MQGGNSQHSIMSYLKHIALKIKYNPTVSILLDVMSKMGVRIQPFYIFVENISQQIPLYHEKVFKEYDICFLGHSDMVEIASIPVRKVNEKELLSRLKKGNICLGTKYHGEIVSFAWCDLNECHYEGYRFTLEEDEAYTFDAYTKMDYRGKELAAHLRYQLYKELTRLERRIVYSISNRFYVPATRFKQKLNARVVDSGTFFDLFKIWHSNAIVKQDRLKHLRKAARCEVN